MHIKKLGTQEKFYIEDIRAPLDRDVSKYIEMNFEFQVEKDGADDIVKITVLSQDRMFSSVIADRNLRFQDLSNMEAFAHSLLQFVHSQREG